VAMEVVAEAMVDEDEQKESTRRMGAVFDATGAIPLVRSRGVHACLLRSSYRMDPVNLSHRCRYRYRLYQN
jgi:hypothetical protein